MTTVTAVVSRDFSPGRLRLARQLRGFRQNKLAALVGVTPAAISQYENGAHVPSRDLVERLALNLKCMPSFFARGEPSAATPAFFRSLSSTPQYERDRAHAYARVLGEIVEMIEEHVELPTWTDPGLRADAPLDRPSVETAALRLREAWGLAAQPLASVVRLLESRGVVVAAVGDFPSELDAFSTFVGPRPAVVLCSAKGSAARRRFDAAHELGHLVLHDPYDPRKTREPEAHMFAAAFLMPAQTIESWLPRRSNELETLREASRVWGVSMQALLYRARTLGIMSESSYVRAMRRISAAGWRTAEPVEIGPPETPVLLSEAIQLLSRLGTSVPQLADVAGLPKARLHRMLSLPEDNLVSPASVVNLATTG